MGNVSCNLDIKIKLNGQKMYFVVNAYPPYPLDVATSNLQVQIAHDEEGILGSVSCDFDPMIKVKVQIIHFKKVFL